MNKLDNLIAKINLKKVSILCLILAAITLLVFFTTIGILYRERICFSICYGKLVSLSKKQDESAIIAAATETAKSSGDVVDIIITDSENNVIFSSSGRITDTFAINRINNSNYFSSSCFPDTVLCRVSKKELVINSVFSKRIDEIIEDYTEGDSADTSMPDAVYIFNFMKNVGSGLRICLILSPTPVPGGALVLKAFAAAAMMFFMLYWIIVALWMYQDAMKCMLPKAYWGLIGLFTNIVGLIVYKVYKIFGSICPNCGKYHTSANVFCTSCGTKIGQTCGKCGFRIHSGDKYCGKCGSKIE